MKNILPKSWCQIIATALLCLGTAALTAQTFPTPTGFNLPAGKTIVITYEVDVNANACPSGTIPPANISNQSNVTGSNFSTVQTDDPDIAGASNPTLTPFGGASVGNLVYNDINRDGDYDAGIDAGINGVVVRIYLDVNSNNVLDAGDGAFLGSTTTATVLGQAGTYSFDVCPGTYIVEVAPSNFNPGGALYTAGAAFVSSPVGGASDPDNGIDNDDNGDPVAGFGVATQAFNVTTVNNTIDFGFKTPTSVIISDVTLAEGSGGGTTAFTFTVSRNDNGETFNLTYNTNDGTAVSSPDYTGISNGTVSFTAGGAMSFDITVLVNKDNIVEADETFIVLLTDAPPGVILADNSGLGTILNDDAAVLTLTGGSSQNEGSTFTFTATLNNAVQGGFTVPYTVNDVTTNAADHSGSNGTLTFTGTAGESHTITVASTPDNIVELNETFNVALGAITGAPAGVTVAGSPQTGTIVNDDAAVITNVADVTQLEANSPQVFTMSMSNPVDASVTIRVSTVNGTATTADNDYNAVSQQSITFNAGETMKTVNVIINNDSKVEPDETYTLRIDSLMFTSGRQVTLGTRNRTGTILNDDSALLTLSGGTSVTEGNAGSSNVTFTVTLSAAVQGGFNVNYAANDGTATTADNDYTDNDGVLAFVGNTSESHTFTVAVNGDLNIEANETFTVTLGSNTAPSGAVTNSGSPQTVTILNDELDYGDAPTTAQSGFAGTYPTTLANNGARHTAALGGLHLGATIDAEADGQPTATASGDGADEDGVTLPTLITGTTASITVNASGTGKLDAWVDFNRNGSWSDAGEQVFANTSVVAGNNTLTFAVPAGASVGTSFARFRISTAGALAVTGLAADGEVEDYQVSILNNQFAIDNPSVAEGNAGTTNLTFTISRSTNVTASSVDYAITGGTAQSGSDYAPFTNGTINFTAGGPMSQTVTVAVNGDLIVENNETVIITLSNPVNGGIGVSPGTGTITNDDTATLTLSGGTAHTEANSGTVSYTFTATLSAAVQGGFQVPYTTNDGTATTADNDYTDNDGILTFAGTAGESQTIIVLANGDIKVELDETFTVALGTLTATSAVQIAAITKAGSPQTGTITNDDAAVVSIAGNISQSEAVTPQTFSVTLSNPVDVAVSVQFNTSDGTATTADNDYTSVSQTVTFAAGGTTAQSVPVTINNDNKVENNEVYNVAIGSLSASGRNVSLGTSTGTGTIINDDAATVTLTPAGGISQNEGNTGTTLYQFFATLNNPVQGGFTVNYTTNNGTATAGSDYIDNDGIVSFSGAAGQSQPISVLVNGDFFVEADETFTVALGTVNGAPAGVTVAGSPQTGTIVNDEVDYGDAPDSYSTILASNGARHNANVNLYLGAAIDGDADGQPGALANGDDTDAEGDDEDGITLPNPLVTNTIANVVVVASAAGKLDGWVDFNNNGSWADAGEKVFNNLSLTAGSNSLSFAVPNGATPSNTFARFRISTAGGLSFNGSAADGEVEDYAVQIVNTQFSINDPVVAEGNAGTSNLTFTITRSNNASACSVNYAITGGTATTADNDYQPLAAGTATFTAGGALTATFNVVVNGDTKVELNETVDVTLSAPVNGSILDGSGTGTITNDDAAVITITNPTVTEGDVSTTATLTFTINMSNPSDANVDLTYNTVDGTATIANNDYVTASGTHTFTPGQTSKTVAVTVNGDCAIETNETLLLRLSALVNNGRNISLSGGGATLDGTGTITNDDALPVITCPANISVNVDPGTCSKSVTLPLPTLSSICGTSTLEFRYRTVDASNVPTGAYTAYAPSASNTVIFSRGRYEIEWRITDGSGSSVCSFYLTVIDNQPPVIVCPANQLIFANASCSAPVGNWTASSVSDNCTPTNLITVTQTPVSNTILTGHNAVTTVTLTANDGNGNTSSCSFTVTLKDVTPPVALCKNISVNLGANGSVTVPPANVNNGSSDNCSFTLTLTPNTFSCANLGINNVVLRATDAGGNTATCTARVTVSDLTAPTALCKNPTIFLDNLGHATLTAAQVNNGSSDACGILSMSINNTEFNCSEIPGSTWPVMLTVKDVNGNSATCSAQVTVKDAIAPTAICEDVTVKLAANGKVTVYGADLAGNSIDNCSVFSYSPIAKVYTAANLGNNNLTITVKDFSGNAATCVSVVTVQPFTTFGEFPPNQAISAPVFDFSIFPNPTSGNTTVAFELPADQTFTLRVFDMSGRLIYHQEDSALKGENYQPIQLSGIAAGVYIVDFQSDDLKAQKRLVIQE